MKATELMIGDWVYDTILKCNTQVEMLSLSGIRGDCNDNVWNEKTFEPIPLTKEIREKNMMLDFYVSMGIVGKDKIVIPFKYVHQLQHALRLCGIDKEIVL